MTLFLMFSCFDKIVTKTKKKKLNQIFVNSLKINLNPLNFLIPFSDMWYIYIYIYIYEITIVKQEMIDLKNVFKNIKNDNYNIK